jgi:hypothetical protein
LASSPVEHTSGTAEGSVAYTRFLDTLSRDHRLYCAKTHRVELGTSLPVIPCLDHEAQLSGSPTPHISVYIEDREGDLHEVGLIPGERRILVDGPSTMAETSPEAQQRMCDVLGRLFPDYRVDLKGPSALRGDRRVAEIIRSQIKLRDVLKGDDGPAVRASLEKIRAISDLMEKESRVFSWGVRTMTPVIGGAGVASYIVIGLFRNIVGADGIDMLRGGVVTVLSTVFLYYGLKAVYLTELGTRVWKRATEYRLVLDARRLSSGP